MKCPNCNAAMNPFERQGVEIDTCPQCRGVWLDRGELDKIIERYEEYDSYRNEPREERRRSDPPRRQSFWQELFD
jgi:Zn-finger nucleic acid-binding protein